MKKIISSMLFLFLVLFIMGQNRVSPGFKFVEQSSKYDWNKGTMLMYNDSLWFKNGDTWFNLTCETDSIFKKEVKDSIISVLQAGIDKIRVDTLVAVKVKSDMLLTSFAQIDNYLDSNSVMDSVNAKLINYMDSVQVMDSVLNNINSSLANYMDSIQVMDSILANSGGGDFSASDFSDSIANYINVDDTYLAMSNGKGLISSPVYLDGNNLRANNPFFINGYFRASVLTADAFVIAGGLLGTTASSASVPVRRSGGLIYQGYAWDGSASKINQVGVQVIPIADATTSWRYVITSNVLNGVTLSPPREAYSLHSDGYGSFLLTSSVTSFGGGNGISVYNENLTNLNKSSLRLGMSDSYYAGIEATNDRVNNSVSLDIFSLKGGSKVRGLGVYGDSVVVDKPMKVSKIGFVAFENLSANGNITLDCGTYSLFNLKLTGNVNLSVSGGSSGTYIICVKQDATGGWDINFSGTFVINGKIDTGPNAYSVISCVWFDSKMICSINSEFE